MHTKFAISLLIFFQVVLSSMAQEDNAPIFVVNTQSGMPSNTIISILKDDLGFMWFATDKGVVRWDGTSAKVFDNNPLDSNTISGNSISPNTFLWDSKRNQIVIGTENGLSFFDAHRLKAENFISNNRTTNFLSSVHVVYIDRQDRLWLGSDVGIISFNRKNRTFTQFPFNGKYPKKFISDKENVNTIFDIKQDIENDSILWLATISGLVKFNKFTHKFKLFYKNRYEHTIDLNTFTKIVAHTNGKIYLSTWNADMVIFNPKINRFERHVGPFASDSSLYFPTAVFPMGKKSSTEIWITSFGSVGIFNLTTSQIQTVRTLVNSNNIKIKPISIFVDTNQLMWLGTEYGVMVYQLKKQAIKNYFTPPIDGNHWYQINTLYEDTIRKKLFTGYAREKGIPIFDLVTNKFSFINDSYDTSESHTLRKIIAINHDTLLLLFPNRINKLIIGKDSFRQLPVVHNPLFNFVDVVADKGGSYWVSSRTAGIQKLSIKDGTLSGINTVKLYFDKRGTIPKFKNMIVDSKNRIWFFNEESYGYYTPENDNLTYFDGNNKRSVLCFYHDKNDTIWVGLHKKGVGFITTNEPEKGIRLVKKNRNRSVFSITKDASGTLYLLTPSGIERFQKNGKTEIFNERDGLIKYDKWSNRDPSIHGKLFKLSDGRIIVGYRRGIGIFQPDNLHKEKEILTPYISSIKIADKKVVTPKGVWFLKNLKLKHNRNSFSIEYSALALQCGKNITLYHKLVGLDNDWVKTGHHSINYSNLSPGSYQFIVQAINNLEPESKKDRLLNIEINAPWWHKWWAWLLFVLVIITIIYLISRFQLKRILEKKETLRLQELNTLKSRLYANITHEFRTPLTVIKGMTNEMTDNMSQEEHIHFDDTLSMINRNSDKLLHLVKQMLDMSKLEEGKMKLNMIQGDIVSFLQYVLESFQSMADVKNIRMMFYHETDKVVMDYDQDKIFMITSNLLSNAIKFTPDRGKIIFHLKRVTTPHSDNLIMKVQDSGIGIDSKHLPNIFDRFYQIDNSLTRKGEGTGIGLALTKELVELMQGSIKVKSILGEQTEFTIVLPISNTAPLQNEEYNITQIADYNTENMDQIIHKGKDSLPLALIMEDNKDVAKYIISCLAQKYRVKWAPDGKKGIEMAINIIPDIIISDVMMPEKDGFEVCETLKKDERTSHIPIILLTARATDNDRIEGLSYGADAYLTKPFNKQELFVRLEQLIKIRRQLQEKYQKTEISLVEKEDPIGEEIFLKKTVEIIQKNIDNPQLNSVLLAANLNLSESQLYRKLRAISGKSTALFIRSIRLSAAKKMLKTSSANISQIAYECGFSNPAWFSRVFKEEFDVSPGTFRKRS